MQRIALALPNTTQDGGTFAVDWKAFIYTYLERMDPKQPRVARPDVIAVRVADAGEKATLNASEPDTFFDVPHYGGMVMVRRPNVSFDHLAELIEAGWRNRPPKKLIRTFDQAATTTGR